jgi:hypothetical protein
MYEGVDTMRLQERVSGKSSRSTEYLKAALEVSASAVLGMFSLPSFCSLDVFGILEGSNGAIEVILRPRMYTPPLTADARQNPCAMSPMPP